MVLASGDRVLIFNDALGHPVAISLSMPASGDRVANIPLGGGKPSSVTLTSPVAGDRVVVVPDSSGKRIAILSDGMGSGLTLIGGSSSTTYYNDIWVSTNGIRWKQITEHAEWSARSGHKCVMMHDKSLVLVGGYTGSALCSDVWRSIDLGRTWIRQTASAGFGTRRDHALWVLSDDTLIMGGGYGDMGYHKNDVWKSPDYGVTWTQQTAAASWAARDGPAFVTLADDTIVILGGGYGTPLYFADVWISTDKGVNWTQIKTDVEYDPWVKRTFFPAVLAGTDIIFVGGQNDFPTFVGGAYKSNDGGTSWELLSAQGDFSTRSHHTLTYGFDTALYITGGSSMNDVWKSIDGGVSWTMITEHANWAARSGHQCIDTRVV
jgi:hypothetical protein